MIKNTFNDRFWTEGNGRNFLEWCGTNPPERHHDSNLFYQFDEHVDRLTENWMNNGDFKSIMKSLHQNSNEIKLPQDYLDFKKNIEITPSWVDMNLIKAGCELSERCGLMGLLVLRDFALLGGYNFANLTKPLVATGALEKGAVHRLYNTLNFWINVSRTGHYSHEKRINACLRTRLVHCVSRLMIYEKTPNWDKDKYGVPINNADMIATNIAFTVYFLYGLQKLNFKYTEQEEQGIFHLWKYVTYLLGVPMEIIPNNKKEALAFFKFWTQYQNAPDTDSMKLTASLLDENTPISLLKLEVIKRNMSYIHKSISNFLIDDTIKSNLKIPVVKFKKIIPKAIQLSNEIPIDKQKQMDSGNKDQLSVLEDYKNSIT